MSYKLDEIIKQIYQNPEAGYEKLKNYIASKPHKDFLDVGRCLIELTPKEKSTFLGNIAKYLERSNISRINLEKNELDATNLNAFVKNLKAPKDISINAEENNIGDAGMLALSKSLLGKKVVSLTLARNKIGDKGIIDFSKHLKKSNLENLNLDVNQFSSKALAEFSKNLPGKLKKLKIGSVKIKPVDAAVLAQNIKATNIEDLDVSSCELGNVGFVEIIKNLTGSKVKSIYAENNKIGNSGAKNAGNYFDGTIIESIRLSDNNIRTQGACDLIHKLRFSNVRTINLAYVNDPKGHNLSLIAKVLRGTPISRAVFDLHSTTSREEKALINNILKENNFSFNMLTRRYAAAKKSIKPFDFTFFKLKLDWLMMLNITATLTLPVFIVGLTSGLFVSLLTLATFSAAISASAVFAFYTGLNLFDFAKRYFTSTDKQKYKLAYEKERENALELSKKLDVQSNKDIMISFARAFDEAPHPKFNDEGCLINNRGPENKLKLLQSQSAKLKELVPQNDGKNNSRGMSSRMR